MLLPSLSYEALGVLSFLQGFTLMLEVVLRTIVTFYEPSERRLRQASHCEMISDLGYAPYWSPLAGIWDFLHILNAQGREVLQAGWYAWYGRLCFGVFAYVYVIWIFGLGAIADEKVVFRAVTLGLLGLLTAVSMWGLRERLGVFLGVQALVVTLCACVWPEMVSKQYVKWWWIASLGGYTTLFVGAKLRGQR